MIVKKWSCVDSPSAEFLCDECELEQVQPRSEKSRGEKVAAVTNDWKELKGWRCENVVIQQAWLNESLSELNANLDVSWNNMQTPSSTKQCVKSKNRLKLLAAFVGSSNSLTAVTQNNRGKKLQRNPLVRRRGRFFFSPDVLQRERIFHLLRPTRCLMGSPGIFKKPQLQKQKKEKEMVIFKAVRGSDGEAGRKTEWGGGIIFNNYILYGYCELEWAYFLSL